MIDAAVQMPDGTTAFVRTLPATDSKGTFVMVLSTATGGLERLEAIANPGGKPWWPHYAKS